MDKKIFVNLPVKNLERSKEFFSKLGFSFDPRFSDKNGACMIIDEDIYAMLLVENFFKKFTKKGIADSSKSTEVIVALSAADKEEVDEIVDSALAAGARQSNEPTKQPNMYGRSFQDLDGHLWEVIYMDEKAFG